MQGRDIRGVLESISDEYPSYKLVDVQVRAQCPLHAAQSFLHLPSETQLDSKLFSGAGLWAKEYVCPSSCYHGCASDVVIQMVSDSHCDARDIQTKCVKKL